MGPSSSQLEPGLLSGITGLSRIHAQDALQALPDIRVSLSQLWLQLCLPLQGFNPGLEVCRAAGAHPQLVTASREHQQLHKAGPAWKIHLSPVGKHQEGEAVPHRGDICAPAQ